MKKTKGLSLAMKNYLGSLKIDLKEAGLQMAEEEILVATAEEDTTEAEVLANTRAGDQTVQNARNVVQNEVGTDMIEEIEIIGGKDLSRIETLGEEIEGLDKVDAMDGVTKVVKAALREDLATNATIKEEALAEEEEVLPIFKIS